MEPAPFVRSGSIPKMCWERIAPHAWLDRFYDPASAGFDALCVVIIERWPAVQVRALAGRGER